MDKSLFQTRVQTKTGYSQSSNKPGHSQSSDKTWTQSEFGQNLDTIRVRTKPGHNQSSGKTWTLSEFGQNPDTIRVRTKLGHSQSSDKTEHSQSSVKTWTLSDFGQNLDTIRVRTNLVHTVGYRAKKINVVTGQSSEKTWHRARVRKELAAFRETLFWILFFHCKWSIISGFIWNNEIPLLVSSDSPNIISSNYKRDKIVIGRLG